MKLSAYFLPVVALSLPLVYAAQWNIINDARVRSKDITPVVGRGFSVATGGFLSICMDAGEMKNPTSDYDFTFVKIIDEDSVSKTSSTEFFAALASPILAGMMSIGNSNNNMNTKKHHFMKATMKIDRYYHSIEEDKATIVEEGQKLISEGNFLQFFQACGPNFIRSIRRTAEVTAIIKNNSDQKGSNDRFHRTVAVGAFIGIGVGHGHEHHTNQTVKSSDEQNVEIRLITFGLSTRYAGVAGSIVARTINDFKRSMNAAFTAAQDPESGFVVSVEVVPWVNNVEFQQVSQLNNKFVRNSYECIRNATTGETIDTCYDSNSTSRPEDVDITCGWIGEVEQNDPSLCFQNGSEDAVNNQARKFNVLANAEFLSTIDMVVREELVTLNIHMRCIDRLMSYHSDYDDDEVHNHLDSTSANSITVMALRWRLLHGDHGTPSSDFIIAGREFLHVTKAMSIQQKITYFVKPCMMAMGSSKFGFPQGKMQYYHWTEMSECNKIMCILPSTEWIPVSNTCQLIQTNFLQLKDWLKQYCPADLEQWHSDEETPGVLNLDVSNKIPQNSN